MRQLLKTSRSFPINQLYRELGQIPARFDIFKLRLFFLKYILNQEAESLIFKLLHLQIENPKRGDWASSCVKNLQDLNIHLSFSEIKEMSVNKYTAIVKKKCEESAYTYLMKKKGKKGKEINYPEIQMSEYLLPNDELSVDEQRNIFEMRNKMSHIPSNFSSENDNTYKCVCGEKENMEHIYNCRYLNTEKAELDYEEVYGENVSEIKQILKRFEHNMNNRENYTNKVEDEMDQGILECDPLFSVPLEHCNG